MSDGWGQTDLHHCPTPDTLATLWNEQPCITSQTSRNCIPIPLTYWDNERPEECMFWKVLTLKKHYTSNDKVRILVHFLHRLPLLHRLLQQHADIFRDIHYDEYAAYIRAHATKDQVHTFETTLQQYGFKHTSVRFRYDQYTVFSEHILFQAIETECVCLLEQSLTTHPIRDRYLRTPFEAIFARYWMNEAACLQCISTLLETINCPWPLSDVYVIASKLLGILNNESVHLFDRFLMKTVGSARIPQLLQIAFYRNPLAHQCIATNIFSEDWLITHLHSISGTRDRFGDSAISWAIWKHRWRLATILLQHDYADLWCTDASGRFPLFWFFRNALCTKKQILFAQTFLFGDSSYMHHDARFRACFCVSLYQVDRFKLCMAHAAAAKWKYVLGIYGWIHNPTRQRALAQYHSQLQHF